MTSDWHDYDWMWGSMPAGEIWIAHHILCCLTCNCDIFMLVEHVSNKQTFGRRPAIEFYNLFFKIITSFSCHLWRLQKLTKLEVSSELFTFRNCVLYGFQLAEPILLLRWQVDQYGNHEPLFLNFYLFLTALMFIAHIACAFISRVKLSLVDTTNIIIIFLNHCHSHVIFMLWCVGWKTFLMKQLVIELSWKFCCNWKWRTTGIKFSSISWLSISVFFYFFFIDNQ